MCIRDRAAREHNALVELMGKSLSSTIEIESLMDMAIASGVDGIILEYTGGHKIDERINEAGKAGIPVVTVLKLSLIHISAKMCAKEGAFGYGVPVLGRTEI